MLVTLFLGDLLINLFLVVLVCVIQKSGDTTLCDRKYPENSNLHLCCFAGNQ